MSLNQFVRYKLLEEEYHDHYKTTDFLHKMFPLLARMIIDGYGRISKISEKHCVEEDFQEIYQTSVEQFIKFGIQVPESTSKNK
ncbi:MAG: hypothetical protein MRQ09_04835 [Candidatus Midichloria sp.]|nr:hypothetical protein [Candidatus Midichloria sp.]